MALEFICSIEIESGKKIILPNHTLNGEIIKYELDINKREIRFFYASKEEEIFALNTWSVPREAREMRFDIFNKNGCYIPIPIFYNQKGNVLKTGNR